MAQLFIDAATRQNPFESSIGYVIKDESSVLEFGKFVGSCDNHIAEWMSLIEGIEQVIALNISTLIIKSDSKIVVDAIHKEFVKNPEFKPYLARYLQLTQKFDFIMIDWIPRDQNKHADHVARRYLKKPKD